MEGFNVHHLDLMFSCQSFLAHFKTTIGLDSILTPLSFLTPIFCFGACLLNQRESAKGWDMKFHQRKNGTPVSMSISGKEATDSPQEGVSIGSFLVVKNDDCSTMLKSDINVSPSHLNDKVIVPDWKSFGDPIPPYQVFPPITYHDRIQLEQKCKGRVSPLEYDCLVLE